MVFSLKFKKKILRSLEHFFLTVGQNNFGNKIPFLFFQILIFSFSIFRYSYYRSSIADKISDYEDIWEPKSERCLSPAESELQFKAYLANKLTQNNGFEDDLPSSYCSSDTTGPRSSSSTTGLSSLNESLESITSSISEESSTGFLETENGMLIFLNFFFES